MRRSAYLSPNCHLTSRSVPSSYCSRPSLSRIISAEAGVNRSFPYLQETFLLGDHLWETWAMRERTKRQSGQSMVEMALLLPFLLFVTLGIIDMGWYIFGYATVYQAAR